VERKLKVRMERQGLLTRSTPLKLWAVLDESVLRRQIGDTAVLAAQLQQLLDMSLTANVTIQVVSFDAGPPPVMVGSFAIVRFPLREDPDIVYVEGASGDIFAEAEDAQVYGDIFDNLRAAALSPAESRQRIERVRSELAPH